MMSYGKDKHSVQVIFDLDRAICSQARIFSSCQLLINILGRRENFIVFRIKNNFTDTEYARENSRYALKLIDNFSSSHCSAILCSLRKQRKLKRSFLRCFLK